MICFFGFVFVTVYQGEVLFSPKTSDFCSDGSLAIHGFSFSSMSDLFEC